MYISGVEFCLTICGRVARDKSIYGAVFGWIQ